MGVALARDLRKNGLMFSSRVVWLLLLPAASSAVVSLHASPLESRSIARHVYFTPATPLDEIPVYSLAATMPGALRGLESEINRLHVHATTLPSGADRRSFETRIYLLEKQLDPLQREFSAERWEILRSAVKREWLDVQSTLPVSSPAAADSTTAKAVKTPAA